MTKLFSLIAIVLLSVLLIGCSERYGGSIYPQPYIPDERPAVPVEADVLADINEAIGANVQSEIVDEIISVESRVYIVIVENGSDTPTFYKVEYYLLNGEWVCIPSRIQM